MPKELEKKLRAEVERKHPNWTPQHKNRYVFGTLRLAGWSPARKKRRKKRKS